MSMTEILKKLKNSNDELILASKSPRRIEILKNAGYNFKSIDSKIDENKISKLIKKPEDLVTRLASEKASAVSTYYLDKIVIAADTVVALKKNIFGKPKDGKEAYNMLSRLNNNTHSVYTGVCIIYKDIRFSFYDISFVTFNNNSEYELLKYIRTGNCFDKAGAYGIQDSGKKLIKNFSGDYYNIMGLPINKVKAVIDSFLEIHYKDLKSKKG